MLALVSLTVAVAVMSLGRGLLRLLPVLCGVAAGYAAALGRVDFSGIAEAPWGALPPNLVHRHLPCVA